MTDPSARITLVTSLPASPGCCAICGKSEHALGFAATDNFDFEFYGTVYFCADCVGDYARVFGFKSPSEMDDINSRLAAQAAELAMLREAVVLLENSHDALTALNNLRRDDAHGDDSGPDLFTSDVPAAVDDVEDVTDAGVAEVVAVDEPSIEPGSNDVRDATSTDTDIAELLAL